MSAGRYRAARAAQRLSIAGIARPSSAREAHGARHGAPDLILAALVLAAIALLGVELTAMTAPAPPPHVIVPDIAAGDLPLLALRTLARMVIALALSTLFALTYAPFAMRGRRRERWLIALLDVLQSVPVLGYLSLAVVILARALPGSAFGYECAAILALFTSQAWNMAFSVYQSLKTVPGELVEVSRVLQLSRRQAFWRLHAPFALPGLVWNAMMSMSGGWFFIVAAEAIATAGETVALPGIGSFIAAAIAQRRPDLLLAAMATMAVVIVLVDALLFRPLVAWSERFRFELEPGATPSRSRLLEALRRAGAAQLASATFQGWLRAAREPAHPPARPGSPVLARRIELALAVLALGIAAVAMQRLVATLGPGEVGHAVALGAITALRVAAMVALAATIWVPIGIWIGLRPRLATRLQPVVQFLAAFPVNLVYPVFVVALTRFEIAPDLGLSPLLVLGTQWYVLFNVIAGAGALPAELALAARSLGVSGITWWRRVGLPAIFPYLVTGLVTASGGAWNASVVAEIASWGDTRIAATGLGAYIAAASESGDAARMALGIAVMCLLVIAGNRLLWSPLYALAERRFRIA